MNIVKLPTKKSGSGWTTGQKIQDSNAGEKKSETFPEYSVYPSADDIYNRSKKMNLDPDDMTEIENPVEKMRKSNDIIADSDLDVPGAELDDKQENIGGEDEENNYYSLGADGHTGLDEDNSGN